MRLRKSYYFVFALCGFALACSWFAAMFLSGENVVTETVFSNEGTMTTAAALKARRDPTRFKPVQVSLTPDMDTLSLSMIVGRSHGVGESEYEVTVKDSDGKVLVSATCRVINRSSKLGGTSKSVSSILHVAKFTVPQADEYLLKVIPLERQSIRIVTLQIRLRRNTFEFPVWVLVCGIAMAFVGMFCGIISVVIASDSSA